MINRNNKIKTICICSIMIALATVLSMIKIRGLWIFGGGITICSMLPLVIISYYYGIKTGLASSFVYSIIQIILGVNNIQYASSFLIAAEIIVLDYIFAYTVLGLSGLFANRMKNRGVEIVSGIIMTFSLRFVSHFISGWIVWDALWPNELGLISPLYSFLYNGSYMLPEMIITSLVALMTVKFVPSFTNNSNL